MRGNHRLAPDRPGDLTAGDVGVVLAIDGHIGHRVGESTSRIAHPDRGRDLGREPGEPDCGVVVGASGLAGCRSVRQGHGCTGAAVERSIDDAGEHTRHGVGNIARQHLATARIRHGDAVAVAILDLEHDAGRAVGAVIGEGGVGASHRERGDLHGAEREGRHAQEWVAGREAHPHLLGDLGLTAQSEALSQGHEVGIGGEGRRLEHVQEPRRPGVADRHRLEGCAIGAVDEVLEGLGIGSIHALGRREALLQRSREGEDLECRSRLHADGAAESLVDVVVVGRLASALQAPIPVLGHGDHVAGAGLDEGDCGGALTRILARDVRRDGLHGRVLDIGVKGGADSETTAPQQRLSLDQCFAEGRVCLDHADDEVTEVGGVGRRAAIGLDRWIEDVLHVHACRGTGLHGGDEAGLGHLSQHEIAALLGEVGIARGVEGRRLLHDPREGGALDEVEFGGRLGEVAS